jgi:threonine synthase
MAKNVIKSDEIESLAALNDVNRRFFEALTTRVKNSAETTVVQAMALSKGTRPEVVELFKRMEFRGLGNFLVGRRGGASRFAWSVRLTDVGRAYAGDIDAVESASTEDLEEMADESNELFYDEMEHEYALRPDFKVEIKLPADLTKREAERLAAFILTLPFE